MTPSPVISRPGRAFACGAALFLVFFGLPASAAAQLSTIGPTTEVASFFVRGVDVAFDAGTGGYFVVGAQNTVVGVCVNAHGAPTRAPIVIKPSSGSFGAYPRARYSKHANGGKGAFLVVWPEEVGVVITLHSRMVSCADGLLGAEQVVSGGDTAWLESGAAIAYSKTSQKFLVVWKSFPPNVAVKARLVDVDGAGVGSVVTLSSGFGRDPGVAWNSETDEFGVSYSGESGPTAYSAFVKVPAANPGTFARTTFNVIGGGLTTITDIDYNADTNRYVMTWFEFPGPHTRVAEFDAAGNLIAQRLASSTLGSYDALSAAYNPISKTFLLTGVDRVNDDVFAAELDGSGTRIGAETKISTSTRPARYTRVASSTAQAAWNAAFNVNNFRAMANQVVQTVTVGSPGTDPTPAPSAPVTPVPRMYIDYPSHGGRVPGNGFMIAGWAIDAASTSGSGVNVVHIWAYPANGSAPVFVGAATYGVSRPDVGAAFGHARFSTAGFGLTAHMAPGTYDIAVFAYSTVSNSFSNAQVVRVTVEAPASVPRMWVDLPAQNDSLSQNVRVAGWALDAGSTTGSGVDAVHVWAYPTNGGPPVLVGVATYGLSRPDVGGAFGSSRFNNSGFNLQGTLPPGYYTLVAFAHSSVVGAFNNVFVISIRVL